MQDLIRRATAIATAAALTLLPAMPLGAESPKDGSGEPPMPPLRETIQKGYPELFDLAPTLRVEPREIQELRQSFRAERMRVVAHFAIMQSCTERRLKRRAGI